VKKVKPNLKDFPSWEEHSKEPHEHYTEALASYSMKVLEWKDGFEKQLRQILDTCVPKESHTINMLKQILGEP